LEWVGVDVYVIHQGVPNVPKESGVFKLEDISNRGAKVSAEAPPAFMLVDWHRCRYLSAKAPSDAELSQLLGELSKTVVWEKVQKLFRQDGEDKFSKAHDS